MKLLIVDDEPDICDFIQDVAEDIGFEVKSISNPMLFLANYSSDYDGIILDLSMPGMDGIEIIRLLGDQHCQSSLILASGFDAGILATAERLALDRGINIIGTIQKPIDVDELEGLLEQIAPPSSPMDDTGPQFIGTKKEPSFLNELSGAISRNEVIPYFQPQVRISDHAFCGVETLARWIHPDRGIIAPDSFIHYAENNGLIEELTQSIFLQSLRQSAEWKKQGLDIETSINFSTKSMTNLNLPDLLSNQVHKYGLNNSQITIEITETSVLANIGNSLDVLTRLRMKGFKLSIDDFGTGYATMQHLRNIPANELKIDFSFVSKALKNKEARAIVETTNDLGKKLGMTVIAEGVEDQKIWDFLEQMGCDRIQGYFVAKPMPGNEIAAWAESWASSSLANLRNDR